MPLIEAWGGWTAGQRGRGQAFSPITNTVVLEEPLVLCDHHLNHGGKSGSNGNVHWVVDRFQLPKHVGRYHNGEVTGSHFVLFTVCSHQVQELEQVLDILVVLSGQVLVLQEVPHRVKLVISFQRAGFQPILVKLSSHQWLR